MKSAIIACCCQAVSAYKATWVWTEKFAKPDGVEHLMYAVNGEYPPTVRVLPGEDVEITVVNKLSSQAMSIHWHGQHHIDTPWQDGAAMFSQCPIPPYTEWTYKFKANKSPGTYLYHGHIGGTAARVVGAFIIDGDISEHAAAATGEHTFMVSDLWHMSEQHISAGVLATPFRWPGDPQSILINGKGRFPCNENEVYTCTNGTCTSGGKVVSGAGTSPWYSSKKAWCDDASIPPLERFEGVVGKTYLLRFIGGSLLSLFNIAIEGHTMTVIEADGYPTEPYATTSIDINAGQRVAVLVQLNQAPKDYVIRFKTRTRPTVRTANAILHYLGSTTSVSDADAGSVPIDQPAWNNHHFTRDFQNNLEGLTNSDYYATPKVPSHDEVVRRFVFTTTHENVEANEYTNVPHAAGTTDVNEQTSTGRNRPQFFCSNHPDKVEFSPDHKNVWMMGRMAFKKPSTPFLGMLHYGIDTSQIGEDKGHYEVEIGKTYDIVVNHFPNCYKRCDTHSWHLHSGHFWSLGTFSGKWTGSQAQLDALNVVNPPLRDSISTASEGNEHHTLAPLDAAWDDFFQPCGYTVLRFKVEHPGLYMFHCHHLFHEMMGQIRMFYTKGSTIPAPPKNVLTCGKMDSTVVQAGQARKSDSYEHTAEQVASPAAETTHAGSPANNIQINVTQVVPGSLQASKIANAEAKSDSVQSFRLTQDGGWIALLILSIALVLINAKSFMMLSRVEGLTQRISSFNDKVVAQA